MLLGSQLIVTKNKFHKQFFKANKSHRRKTKNGKNKTDKAWRQKVSIL